MLKKLMHPIFQHTTYSTTAYRPYAVDCLVTLECTRKVVSPLYHCRHNDRMQSSIRELTCKPLVTSCRPNDRHKMYDGHICNWQADV